MKGHLGQALPGPPNGLADLESAGGPVASQGPTPHPAAPVPYGPTVPVCGPGRIGVALSTGPPGATRRVASIFWSGAVTPPPPSTEHMFLYHTLPTSATATLRLSSRRPRRPSQQGSSAPGGTRTPDPRMRRPKRRVQPAPAHPAWCCSVRRRRRFELNRVLPVGSVLSCPAPSVCKCLQDTPRPHL